MTKEFQIIKVPDDVQREQEQMGTKPKFWFENSDYGYCLFKEGHPNTGEDWAERVASELCELLMIPHALYKLAVWQNKPGVLTPNFVGKNEIIVPGNEVLFLKDSNYPISKKHKVKEHNIEVILMSLDYLEVKLLREWSLPGITTAARVFIGYLMLDAWIGNTDRHHENWALIQNVKNGVQINRLAPTHDHAASFGCILRDEERRDRLTTKDKNRTVAAYVARGRSAVYENKTNVKPLPLIEAFRVASSYDLQASNLWLDKLENVTIEVVREVFERIPSQHISEVSKEFAIQMLEINRQRLLELKR